MMRYLLYFLIALGATAIGALSGMGGGVIIKPILDALGDYSAADIGVLSSVTVFFMALISSGKQIRRKAALDLKIAAPLAVGSLLGGAIGDRLLRLAIAGIRVNRLVVAMQNILLMFIVIVVFFYMRKKDRRPVLNMNGIIPAILTGIFLGAISSFLGIGGGPANVALILFIFACSIKTATVCSIIIILFSQASKLASVLISGTFLSHNISMLPAMVTGAVLGGWLGSRFNQSLPDNTVEKAFSGVQVFVFLICLVNIFRSLFQ